ncbi:MAG: hypothetical protein F6K19_23155 [Cyanothece sp. SIO1E1]|nr:hypothetical protein [Cyanothece sp. SIO1E1]
MPTKFLAELGGKLAERWFTTLFIPAFIFWIGGLGTWMWRFGWIGSSIEGWFIQQSEFLQFTIVIGALLLIGLSAFTIQRFDLLILRLLEGYWPSFTKPVRIWLIKRQQRWLKRSEKRWQVLALKRENDDLNTQELNELISLDLKLRQHPSQHEYLMPTKLGNLLRAAERRPLEKYGLDAVICWPRLWLLLPEDIKKELQEARADLNTAARTWLWSILFLVWTVWVWWAILISISFVWFAYRWILSSATTYADLLEAVFDLYRLLLYQAMNWPLPQDPSEELQLGKLLTEYLWRGSDQPSPKFVHRVAKR